MYKRVMFDLAKNQIIIFPTFGFTKDYWGYYMAFAFLCFRLAIMLKKS